MSDSSGGGINWFGTSGAGASGEDDLEGVQPPSQKLVDLFHGKASTTEPTDLHHRIGFGPGDVSPAQHTHDGVDSYALFSANQIPGAVPGAATNAQLATALNAVIGLLQGKSS